MKRVFIIRKDLNICNDDMFLYFSRAIESYWLIKIRNELFEGEDRFFSDLILNKEEVNGYINSAKNNLIYQAKNLDQLLKVRDVASQQGLIEGVDFGFVEDLSKEDEDNIVMFWSKPVDDAVAELIVNKYLPYIDKEKPATPQRTSKDDIVECPGCSKEFSFRENKKIMKSFYRYCQMCGQKFDWDRFEFKED